MKKLHLSIELLEDLHIGTGTGIGDIDALQVRDRRGLPVLPSSHIKGVLLQTAHDLMKVQPEAISQTDIETLFGRPGGGQGCVQLTSAYLPDRDNFDAIDTLLWGSTGIDPKQGRAQETSLRLVEYIPAGRTFTLQAFLPSRHQDLLTAIIGRCTRLGAGRNRGYGLVCWRLQTPNGKKSLVQIPQKAPAYPQRLRLLLRNLDPVCLAQTAHPGNLIASDAFIRGRALRGSFAAACITLGKPEWVQTLLDPELAWADALPLPVEKLGVQDLQTCQVLPIALSIGTPKASAPQTDLPWWVLQQAKGSFGARGEVNQIDLPEGQRLPEKLKRPAANEFLFRASQDVPWRRYIPEIHERLRTSVPRSGQQDEQALFSNEEIAEQTLFLADLIVTNEVQAKTLAQLVQVLNQHWLRIGRGGKPLVLESAQWLAPEKKLPAQSGCGDFTLLLLSELIARDALGNFHDSLNAPVLCQLAGLPADSDVQIEKNYSEGLNLYGFNALTGLPRMAQRGIKAGSIVRISGADAAKLRATLAQKDFLGESPEEGFGRFVLDLPLRPTPIEAKEPLGLRTPTSFRHEDLCKKARTLVQRYAQVSIKPSKSQWGDFRNQVQAAHSREQLEAVFTSIDAAAKTQGGKAWKFLAGENGDALRKAVQNESQLADAQDLLNYFLCWQGVQNNRTQETQESQA